MRYSYDQAAAIIAWPAATIATHAARLGLGSLDDDALQAVWEAIESATTSIEVRETVGCDHVDREKTTSQLTETIINGAAEREPIASKTHFSGSRGQAKFNTPASLSDEESLDRERLISSSKTPGHADSDEHTRDRINGIALRGLDVEIATRESELATMRRARAVLARDVEGSRTAAACGDKAQEGT